MFSGPSQSAPRGSLVESLTRMIADEIVRGSLGPGQRLDEHTLARRFGVSRTPVRESLRLLAASGLAERRPHRGVFVTSVTPERLAEMFEVMAEMEALCARLAAERMTAGERRTLEGLHADTQAHIRRGDIDGYEVANVAFHKAIYAGAHNAAMTDLTLEVRRRLAPFRRAQFRVLGRLGKSFEEHDQVVRAILRGDGDSAAKAMRAHILTVGDSSETYIAEIRHDRHRGAGASPGEQGGKRPHGSGAT